MNPPRIGLVDSGASPCQHAYIDDAAAFVFRDDALWRDSASVDQLGHGSRVLDIVRRLSPDARFYIAQVFHASPATSALQVAAAIDWLVETGVDLINLSLGLREPRPTLTEACRRASESGVILCAATPACGEPVFPAACPNVWRVTGDARCAWDEWSCLQTAKADFGAHVAPSQAGGGASMACAHMSGHIARLLADDVQRAPNPMQLRECLQRHARYHKPELILR
ncbi:hypothetical protein FACS1894185_1250 [Betaproteobacteria bacterium]|nr:hypothetical protein AGMMS49545_03910 [Betaproteobacteria bacterium]GHU10260.1 hypothetical protein FACS1894185_1250 [Betaproteobacteria bacterium]GHU41819.1 hypothetical protein AGMMS50289_05590 [Betaproteobacteria bacterium]